MFWASVCLCGVMGRWTVFRFKLSVCLSREGPTSQLGRHSPRSIEGREGSGCLWLCLVVSGKEGTRSLSRVGGGLKLTSFLRRACARWRYWGGGATDMGIWGWWNDAPAAITRGGYKCALLSLVRSYVGRGDLTVGAAGESRWLIVWQVEVLSVKASLCNVCNTGVIL